MASYLCLEVLSKHSLIGELPLQEFVITAEHQKKNCKWSALLASWELLPPNLLGLPTPVGILALLCLPNQTCQTHTFWVFLHFILNIPWLTLVVYHYSKKEKKKKHELQIHLQNSLSFKSSPLLDVCASFQGSLKYTRSTWPKSWILWLGFVWGHLPWTQTNRKGGGIFWT